MNKNGSTTMGQDSAVGDRLEGIKDSVKGLVEKGGARADEIKTRVIEVKDQAMTRGNAFVDQAGDFIKANPLKAVGIAFGLGYVGMRLFRR